MSEQTTYLVGRSEESFSKKDFVLVDCVSEQEAVIQFVRTRVIIEDLFLDHVADRSVNAGFAENFILQTDEEQSEFALTGELVTTDSELRDRVMVFFGEHEDFAKLYLSFFFGEVGDEEFDEYGIRDEDRNTIAKFPEDMLLYMALNSHWTKVTAIPIDEIEIIKP